MLCGMANSVDPDQTAPTEEQSDLALLCLHVSFFRKLCSKFKDIYCKHIFRLKSECPFQHYLVISTQWNGDNESLCHHENMPI